MDIFFDNCIFNKKCWYLYYIYLSVVDIANPHFFHVVVGPGYVSTAPALMRSSTSCPAGPYCWFVQKNGKSCSHCWGRRCRHNLHIGFPDNCDISTACMMCRLEPIILRVNCIPSKSHSCTLLIHKSLKCIRATYTPSQPLKIIYFVFDVLN